MAEATTRQTSVRDGTSPEELREWVAKILEREQMGRVFGTVTVHIAEGTIVRIDCNRTEKPPRAGG